MNKERKLPWFELRDLPYCMVLPLLAVIALVVPQHLWQRLCKRLVGLFILGTPAIRRGLLARIKEALGPSQIGIRPEVICAGYVVNKLLVQLEYYRALSPWGWSCETKLFGREHVDKALRAGKGVILWVTPANSSDLVVKRCLAESGLSFSQLSVRTHGYSESRFGFVALNGPNRYVENKYLAHRIVLDRARPIRAIRELQRRISRNEIVSITAIENTGGDSFEVRCFNCLLPIGVGPVW
ncbi:MAG: hypothetical protein O7G83_22910, partial [Proteobacteria bacterium]|nr:hypothetical protein [Pseudomonadota bacterium]